MPLDRIDNVEILPHTEARELLGKRSLEGLVVSDARQGTDRRLDVSALFVFIGAEPRTARKDELALDAKGVVLTAARFGTWTTALLPSLAAAERLSRVRRQVECPVAGGTPARPAVACDWEGRAEQDTGVVKGLAGGLHAGGDFTQAAASHVEADRPARLARD